jgi:hypothetical protein
VNVTAIGTAAAPANSDGFSVGDIVMFHQSQRTTNAGRSEFDQITAINTPNSWTLARPLTYSYDNTNGRAQVIKVPQYHNVTVQAGGALTAPAWDGSTGGILVFRATGITDIQSGGSVSIDAKGYRGGAWGDTNTVYHTGQPGESFNGLGASCNVRFCTSNQPNNGGGGGGGKIAIEDGSGGGGGYATAGGKGPDGGLTVGIGGEVYGDATLSMLLFGSGGGGTFWNYGAASAADGGNGGGAILIYARTLIVNGEIHSNGADGTRGGMGEGSGGGSGGSIKLITNDAQISTHLIIAKGGAGGPSSYHAVGGAGGAGRIRVETCGAPPDPSQVNPDASIAQIDCVPPTAFFTPPIPTRQPYGLPLTLRWDGSDNPGGSGIRSFTLQQSVVGSPTTDVVQDTTAREQVITLTLPCRVFTFSLTATDNGDNVSPVVTTQVQTVLQGDISADGVIDASDLAAIESAAGLTKDQPRYEARLDINGDGRVDTADALWVRRRLGDRCPAVILGP